MTIGDKNVAVVSYDNITWSIEVFWPVSGNTGCSQPHQHLATGAELDYLMSPVSLWSAGRGDRIRDPHVSFGIDIDSVRPNEHSATEARYDVAVQVEFQNRVQVRIETLVAETLTLSGITPNDCPEVFAVRIDRQIANGPHFPAIRQLRPTIDEPIRIREGLRQR